MCSLLSVEFISIGVCLRFTVNWVANLWRTGQDTKRPETFQVDLTSLPKA